MKVIICGAGQVGWQIARHLSGERNDVTVVDNNPDLVRRATDALDVQGIAGFASYPDVLDQAGARDADMIIAATHSDEVNMVTCQVAHSGLAVPRQIARLWLNTGAATRAIETYCRKVIADLVRRGISVFISDGPGTGEAIRFRGINHQNIIMRDRVLLIFKIIALSVIRIINA